MRLKLTLLLFVLNLLAFGAIVFLERRAEHAGSETLQESILPVEIDQIRRMEITGPVIETPRAVERGDINSPWQVTLPDTWPANRFAVTRILNQIQFLQQEISFSLDEIEDADQSLADYGLEPAQLILSIYTDSPDPLQVFMGASTEMGNRLYLRIAGEDRIYVVKRDIIESLSISMDALRDPKVFRVPVFEVRSLTMRITQPGNVTIRLVRENEAWRFEAPLTAAADPVLVNTTIKELTGIEAIDFFAPGTLDPATAGLEAPARRVTLEGNGRRETLLLGNVLGDRGTRRYFARREDNPTIVTVPAGPFDALFEAQQKLRDASIFSLDPDRLKTITLEHASKRVSLQKLESGSWQVVEAGENGLLRTQPADPDLVYDLRIGLQQLQAREFVSDAPTEASLKNEYGLAEPQWTLSLATEEKTERLLIGEFYQTPGDEILLYAKREDRNTVYGISRGILRWLRVDGRHYRDRNLRVLPRGARIQSVRITRLEDDIPVIEHSIDTDSETWSTYVEATELAPEQKTALLNLVQQLRALRVSEYIRDRFTENYLKEENKTIPWDYRLELNIELPGGEDTIIEKETYVLTRRLSGSFQAAASRERQLVFSLSPELVESVGVFLFDRDPPPEYIPPSPIPLEPSEATSEPGESENPAPETGAP